jgi:hypothetical protein
MFANLTPWFPHRPRSPNPGFIEEVKVTRLARRNRHIELIFIVCWTLIAVKCVFVAWAVHHYRMPFSPMWVIGPTVAFAALATAIYLFRD